MRPSDLPVDAAFQRRSARVELAGQCVMLLVVGLALVGLFGPGLMGRSRVSSTVPAVSIEYDRMLQVRSPTLLTFELQTCQGQKTIRVRVDKTYLDSFDIKQVLPVPTAVESDSDHWRYSFPCDSAGEPLRIQFMLACRRSGRLEGRVFVMDVPLSFRQFAYP